MPSTVILGPETTKMDTVIFVSIVILIATVMIIIAIIAAWFDIYSQLFRF